MSSSRARHPQVGILSEATRRFVAVMAGMNGDRYRCKRPICALGSASRPLIIVLVMLFGGISLASRYFDILPTPEDEKERLVELQVVLTGEEIHDALALTSIPADFQTPPKRLEALSAVIRLSKAGQLERGRVIKLGESSGFAKFRVAENRYDEQRQRLRAFHDSEARPARGAEAVLLGLILTENIQERQLIEGGTDAARRFLRRLDERTPGTNNVVQLYYSPRADQHLTTEQAIGLMEGLRD